MSRCLISLGANLGDPIDAIELAQQAICHHFCSGGDSFQLSPLFRTPPVGGPSGQPPFINAVAAVHTQLDVWQAWHAIRRIEAELGRVRQRRWEARTIDLDILLFDDLRIWTPQLKIPHPRMCMRRFILAPARQVAAEWLDPVSQLTIAELAEGLRSGAGNLVLIARSGLRAAVLLEEVARLGVAKRRQLEPVPSDPSGEGTAASFQLSSWSGDAELSQRWVALLEPDMHAGIDLSIDPAPKLSVFLAEPTTAGTAWEDCHRSAARGLRLAEGSGASPFTVAGPRYLLASDDADWAVHELVSALDAMDCPVEIIQ